MIWTVLHTWVLAVSCAVMLLLGAGTMAWWKLAELVKDRTLHLQAIARARENERMIHSVRESQIAGLMHVIGMGTMTELHPQDTIVLIRSEVETALITGGMQIRMRNGIVLGRKQ